MGGPVFDRQVFVKKTEPKSPLSRSPLPGGLVLLLVAALSAFATYRYVKAGGKDPSNAADQARIAELQTKLKAMQDRVNELESRRHAAPTRRAPGRSIADTAKTAPGESRLRTASLARPAARVRGETPANGPIYSTDSGSTSTKPAASVPASVKAPELATKAPATNGQTVPTKELNAIQGNLAASHDEWRATTDRLGNVVGELDTQRSAIQQTQNGVNYLLERVQGSDVSFTLTKGAGIHRIGPIPMELESTSVREQHYTVRMMVDDKSVVLKDRALNEIVQFYTSRSKYPLRLIVSQIGRGEVSGTLAVPTELSNQMNNTELQAR
ncbi:MAG TPA: hypothetical protein VGW37_04730 [Terriglobia bacterium]|nr:hypothetical protein [Terriglobia bacterium]